MIIEIDSKYLVSTEIFTEFFACDYPVCKGSCCIVGDSGAPLLESECSAIKNQFCQYKEFLSHEGLQAIKEQGFSVIDIDGDLVTPLIKNLTGKYNERHGACAYSFTTPDGFTLCAIEKGYKKNSMRKPISCWLYPIRTGVLSNGYISLMLSREHLCKEAFAKGRKEGIRVYEFLREPLIYKFGEKFYEQLQEAAKEIIATSKTVKGEEKG